MQSVLLVDSGSDLNGVPGAAEIHADRLSSMLDMPVRYAYLSRQAPNIRDALRECILSGSDRIVLLPLMIASEDECRNAILDAIGIRRGSPGVYSVDGSSAEIVISEPFIVHPLMKDIFRNIMNECRAHPRMSEAVLINRCPADSSGDSIANMCAGYLQEMGYGVRLCRLGRGRQTAGTVLKNMSRGCCDCIAMIPMMSTPEICSRCSVPQQLGIEGCPGSRSVRPGSRVHYTEEIGMRPGIVYILKSIVEEWGMNAAA